MAEWYVRFLDATVRAYIGDYTLNEPTIEIRNSEPGGFTGEIALSQRKKNQPSVGIGRDEFAPYSAHYELWRDGLVIQGGMITSLNFNKDRDTALVSGKDWLHYLQRRIFPFDPELYISGDWVKWPVTWPDTKGSLGPAQADAPVDVALIIRKLIQSLTKEPPTPDDYTQPALKGDPPPDYGPPLTYTWPSSTQPEIEGAIPIRHSVPIAIGKTTKYQIYPGDSTTIYDHITKLSEQVEKGFEFDIGPLNLDFRIWSPRRNPATTPVYHFRPGLLESTGAIVEFDWTNEGPEGTYLVGLGSGKHKTGQVWTTRRNVDAFKRLDKVYDFGELQNTDLILEMLRDQNDLHPQKKLSLSLWNPQFLTPNFYSGGRPRALLGAPIRVTHDFAPLHLVDAYFRINSINIGVDRSTNETVNLELEQIYEPEDEDIG